MTKKQLCLCQTKNDKKSFEVRPKRTRDERIKMFKNGNSYIGKI